jgi:phosphoribosylanthranilate isomerase
MNLLDTFLSTEPCSLKICGVTRRDDALMLLEEHVPALGVNFWPLSKRFIAPDDAAAWLEEVAGRILRVGVFVNAERSYIEELMRSGIIDVAQLHGDESAEDVGFFHERGMPVIKAWGVKFDDDPSLATHYSLANAWLLDAPAAGQYGGTGATFDWSLAAQWRARYPQKPILLAGGITPANAAEAVRSVHPAALDVASGAEISPGIKDRQKVRALMAAISGRA